MHLNEALNWRYATKRMNGEKVSDDKIENILNAIRMTPTSLGLQSFKAFVIENPEKRQEIFDTSCKQPQILECSHLIVFAARKDLKDSEIEEYMNLIANTRGISADVLSEFKGMITGTREQVKDYYVQWSARQTYIALGFGLIAAAEQAVDSTPMEGFSIPELDKLLGLEEMGLTSTLILTLGYRNPETDYLVNAKKVRKPAEDLFVRI